MWKNPGEADQRPLRRSLRRRLVRHDARGRLAPSLRGLLLRRLVHGRRKLLQLLRLSASSRLVTQLSDPRLECLILTSQVFLLLVVASDGGAGHGPAGVQLELGGEAVVVEQSAHRFIVLRLDLGSGFNLITVKLKAVADAPIESVAPVGQEANDVLDNLVVEDAKRLSRTI